MAMRNDTKIKRLGREVPEGLLVTSAWLGKRGYSSSLRSQYVASGWLEQPARSVFRRPRGEMRWQQVVVSLQTLLEFPVLVGGRTALELQGYGHYVLFREREEVHLYGPRALPVWMGKLPLKQRFFLHKSGRLFGDDCARERFDRLSWEYWDWRLAVSSPERALLEILDELPGRESFHIVDKFVEGLVDLRPKVMQKLLEDCRSVKVKRLLFFFAERHGAAWLKRVDRRRIHLGKGDRMLVRGGRFDPVHRITVAGNLDDVA